MAEPDTWDAEDFEPELPSKQQEDDKWAGEDEDKGGWENNDNEDGDKKDSAISGNNTESTSLDHMAPLSEVEFDKFGEALKSKVRFFEDSQHYSSFVVQLINELSLTLNLEEVKKLGISVNSLYHEKERLRKEAEKKKKKKNKISIKVDRADDLELIGDATGGGSFYDDDDFI